MPEKLMQEIFIKSLSWHRLLSGLLTIALHGGAIALIGMQWESPRFAAPSLPAIQVMPIQMGSLLPSANFSRADETSLAAPLFEGAFQPTSSIVNADLQTGSGQADRYTLPPVYLTASELDVRPYPEAEVVIPFPDMELGEGKVEGVLVLYVDIDGKVDRIEVRESTLPPLLEHVAMSSFMQAKMQPGMKEGKAVRSQMKVLVEFEAHNAY
jgi:outer membrane biosynthesis protein TonB